MLITLVPELIRLSVGAATKLVKGVSPFQRFSSKTDHAKGKTES